MNLRTLTNRVRLFFGVYWHMKEDIEIERRLNAAQIYDAALACRDANAWARYLRERQEWLDAAAKLIAKGVDTEETLGNNERVIPTENQDGSPS